MVKYWRDLSERERMLIMIGGGLAAVFVMLQLILSPALTWRTDQKREMSSSRSLYELVAEAAPLGMTASVGTGADTEPARNIVSQTASASGVAIVFINARGDRSVDVNITSASPDALFQWLAILRADHNIVVDTADIARETGNPQTVRAQLTMSQRGGS